MKKLDGKTAVVTGGGTGIGFATAKRFVDEGAFVYVTGRRREPLDRAVEALGASARAVQGSVSDLADLARLFDQVRAERGTLDILFANAGHGDLVPLGEITEEQYQRTFDINVKGVLFTVQAALPLMRAGGSIILTGSTTGSMGTPAFSVYSATKAAVRNFARSWAQDLRGTGIRVNVLSPGPTLTELAQEVVGRDAMVELGAGTPIGRVGQPDEIAAVATFLASSDSSFMTGSEVFADGGLAQI
ncbi:MULTISPECIES: SDR family NAD(P)-dependent oxidoreductase [unclassified Sphingomonas]|uniref:SDR family NAD(P)-dependent oxidoreductase n=1 Tax=unclassified Sphingomonas TaxID=196159 RepID=UPI00160F2AD8|nr:MULTISPECIES: SDR family oxidoreductase [unclassified Sphingomonas]MBB3347962.1 NAD(P)-dependent dehydrogenase (short-subunit alcohol dehydrogenase family) [Sphingomonas sp. BK069]MBB3473957.1 NAD(P)-dependent dehydrogenase (short-subunit alcohol dehydrogenase family) [Sphingomonas sp. BK345]